MAVLVQNIEFYLPDPACASFGCLCQSTSTLMAASIPVPLHPVNATMLHDLLSDSQDFVGAMDEGDDRSRKAEEFEKL